MRVGTASLPRMRVAKGWNGAVDTNAAVRQGEPSDRAASLRQNQIGREAGASPAKMSEPRSSVPV